MQFTLLIFKRLSRGEANGLGRSGDRVRKYSSDLWTSDSWNYSLRPQPTQLRRIDSSLVIYPYYLCPRFGKRESCADQPNKSGKPREWDEKQRFGNIKLRALNSPMTRVRTNTTSHFGSNLKNPAGMQMPAIRRPNGTEKSHPTKANVSSTTLARLLRLSTLWVGHHPKDQRAGPPCKRGHHRRTTR